MICSTLTRRKKLALPANRIITRFGTRSRATTVYGFAAPTRPSEPTALVFQVPRAGLTIKVHQRVNVRVLELIENASGSRIELEGNRLPVTHSKDVIDTLGS